MIHDLKTAIEGLHAIMVLYGGKTRTGHPLVLHRKTRKAGGAPVLYLEFLQHAVDGDPCDPVIRKLIVDRIQELDIDLESEFSPVGDLDMSRYGEVIAVALPLDPS